MNSAAEPARGPFCRQFSSRLADNFNYGSSTPRLSWLPAFIVSLTVAASPASSLAKSHEWCPPFGLERVGAPDGTNEFEADAVAVPEPRMNPVDLGAILVPESWLLLGRGQAASVEAAALSRGRDLPDARLRVWFSSEPGMAISMPFPLSRSRMPAQDAAAIRPIETRPRLLAGGH